MFPKQNYFEKFRATLPEFASKKPTRIQKAGWGWSLTGFSLFYWKTEGKKISLQ